MTIKDMNLSLAPRAAARPRARDARIGSQAMRKSRATVVPAAANQPAASRSAPNSVSTVRDSRLSPLLLALMLLNTLALPAMGYWLYDHFEVNSRPVITNSLSASDLAAATGSIDQNLAELETSVSQLQVALAEQQRLFSSALLDLQQQLANGMAEAEASHVSQVVAAPLGQWVVNAGIFSSLDSAESVQGLLAPLGYEALRREVVVAGVPSYRVQIPGFDDRASAEEVARKIMGQTGIHGLWVWKGD
tara:strand:- start:27679 stop:28422 length:744 start_codon:yes stop_codon:yes gene_type:complete